MIKELNPGLAPRRSRLRFFFFGGQLAGVDGGPGLASVSALKRFSSVPQKRCGDGRKTSPGQPGRAAPSPCVGESVCLRVKVRVEVRGGCASFV